MSSTSKFHDELTNIVEKVRLNLVGITTDSLGAILTKLTSYNPNVSVFNNIDELAIEENPDFKIYYKNLPHLNNLKEENFKLNNQFIDCKIKFKNILLNDDNTYTYIVASKNLIKGRPKLPDLRVINGFELSLTYTTIKVYYDNYLNFSIFISKVGKKTVNYYLQNNLIKFPIFCFYCSKARNLKNNCFSYNNFKKNMLDDIGKFMEKYEGELFKVPSDLISLFANYFDNYSKVNIPQTRSLDSYKNYLCCYKYNFETLKCLRTICETIDKCNNQLVNEEDLKSLKNTIETQNKLIKLNEENIIKLNRENDNLQNESNFLTDRITIISENYEKLNNNNLDLIEQKKKLSLKNKRIEKNNRSIFYINIFLSLLLILCITFIKYLEPDMDLYYDKIMFYYNYSIIFMNDIFNGNYTNMYMDDTFYDENFL